MDIKIPIIIQPLITEPINDTFAVTPVPVITPVAAINPDTYSAAGHQQHWLNATLRQLLPQQTSPALLLTHILQDLPTILKNDHLPPALKILLQNLIQAIPQAQDLTKPQMLEQTIQTSGLFLEATLLQQMSERTPSFLQQDFKANLLKLKTALEQLTHPHGNTATESPAELSLLTDLHKNTTGALNKILVDQLASLPKEDPTKQVWFIEIPFLAQTGTDILKLEIERDTHNTSTSETDQAPCWSVTLTITTPGLGKLYCKVSFSDNTLNTYFRSEDDHTLKMIEQSIAQLRARFEAVGLKPGHIDAQKGQLAKQLSNKLHQHSLIDDRA
ncbi:MAG: flagellar hook-length control protein FliK [Methylococcales bacterium]